MTKLVFILLLSAADALSVQAADSKDSLRGDRQRDPTFGLRIRPVVTLGGTTCGGSLRNRPKHPCGRWRGHDRQPHRQRADPRQRILSAERLAYRGL